jgi:hypothetical protein
MYQSGHIGYVYPEAVLYQAQGIVRILASFVVNGEGREMGEIHPGFRR